MQNQPTISPDPLDLEFANLAPLGWRVQYRTPTTMQLVKPKTFKATEGVLLAIVCGALVLLAGVGGILLALLLAVGDFIWYAARRDETRLLTIGPDGRQQDAAAAPRVPWHGDRCIRCVHPADRHAALVGRCNTCGCARFMTTG